VGAVPRYFFSFTDGQRVFGDADGQELPGLQAARAHATRQVRDLKAAMCDPHIQDLSSWSMVVTDAAGRTVFVLGFDMKPRMETARPAQAAPHGGYGG
jgi:hypothetical protein